MNDGVSLCSTPHPRAPWWERLMFWRWMWPRLNPDSLETIEIEVRNAVDE